MLTQTVYVAIPLASAIPMAASVPCVPVYCREKCSINVRTRYAVMFQKIQFSTRSAEPQFLGSDTLMIGSLQNYLLSIVKAITSLGGFSHSLC